MLCDLRPGSSGHSFFCTTKSGASYLISFFPHFFFWSHTSAHDLHYNGRQSRDAPVGGKRAKEGGDEDLLPVSGWPAFTLTRIIIIAGSGEKACIPESEIKPQNGGGREKKRESETCKKWKHKENNKAVGIRSLWK
jgi:hypothetical protein